MPSCTIEANIGMLYEVFTEMAEHDGSSFTHSSVV